MRFVVRLAMASFCFVLVAQNRLDIDRLYRLPWVIGTAPKDFVWSTDSQRLAFLWNDEGNNFYDVWVASTDDAKPVRVTRMARPEAPANPGTDVSEAGAGCKG